MQTKTKFIGLIAFTALLITSTFYFNDNCCTEQSAESNIVSAAGFSASPSPEPVRSSGKSKYEFYKLKSIIKGKAGKATDFTWEENGKVKSFSKLTKNKVVFLNFWATWCGPCRKEIPDIIEIDNEMSKDLIVIGVSLDRGPADPTYKKVLKFIEKNKITYLNILGSVDLAKAYGGIGGIPTTFIIDKKGNIAETMVGMRSKAAFLKSIKRVMKKG